MDNKKAEGIEVIQSKAIKEKKTRKEKYKEKLEEQLLPRKKTIMINGKKGTLIQNFLFPICKIKLGII